MCFLLQFHSSTLSSASAIITAAAVVAVNNVTATPDNLFK